jgi:crotonobetainyl-CoA:carnitine CoA-transferase CaiB-like acyl-CoA transferase
MLILAVGGRMTGPLVGVRVLDVTHVMAGSFCTMLLADMGADVIKVERPGRGDETRGFGGSASFQPFVAVNRNKRALALDLSDPRGADILRRLAERVDVFVENFRPGAMTRLGLGYDDLKAAHPGLIYCSISGFGATGPYRERGGFDLVAQGMSGIMSFTGQPGGPPVKAGVPVADLSAGMYGANGILAAYIHRLRTGEGQFVDTSLLEGAIAYTAWESAMYFATGQVAEPTGSAHRLSAPYQALRTADGWLVLGAANQSIWERLCRVVGTDLMADTRFALPRARLAHRHELAAELEAIFQTEPTATWIERLLAAGVPCGPVYRMDEVYDDPHVQARDMVVDTDHPIAGKTRHIGVPVKLSATPGSVHRPAPLLGEHSEEVLLELGVDPAEVRQLVDAGVVEAGGR